MRITKKGRLLNHMVPMTTLRGWGPFPDLVEELSGAAALHEILHRHDLPLSVLSAPDHRIPLAKMMRVFEAAARLAGDAEFGVLLGSRTNAAHYGPWAGYAYCAPTLGAALKRVCSTLWAHESGTQMYLVEHEYHVVWCYKSGLAGHETVRHFSDHLFETMLVFFRGFLGPDWRPDWVELDYEKPAQTRKLEAALQTRIRFACPHYGVAVRKEGLTAQLQGPLPFPRPITSLDLAAKADRFQSDPVDEVLNMIDLRIMDGRVDLDGLARSFDIGPRTLQRRLLKLGYTYKQLLEIVRRRRAAVFLLETDLPVKRIAAELGYDGPQNFTRAFNTWFETSPSEFRSKSG